MLFRTRVQKHGGGVFPVTSANTSCFSGQVTRRCVSCDHRKRLAFVFFAGVSRRALAQIHEEPRTCFRWNWSVHLLRVSKPRSFFFWCCWCCVGTSLRVTRFPDQLPSCGSGRTQKRIRCWVFFFHLSVCGCEVLSCSVSTSFQMPPACFCVAGCCFDFLFRYGFGHGCTSKEGIKIRLCCVLPHMCYVVDWCCVGTNLVHNTGFLTISHAVCLVGTQNTSV